MLNKFLQPDDGYVTTRPQQVTGISFDTNYEIQTRNIRVSNFVNNAGTASAIGTGLVNGTSFTVGITLTPQNNKSNFGVPYISVYQGTFLDSSYQIYPSFGPNIANQKYAINSGFDWDNWDNVNSRWSVNIENNSGSTQSFFIVADWKELRFTQKKSKQ